MEHPILCIAFNVAYYSYHETLKIVGVLQIFTPTPKKYITLLSNTDEKGF